MYLNENDIIELVIKKLLTIGFTIENTCNTKERGIDIVAIRNNIRLLIEAKGETTSMDTNRKGKPFTRNQARHHISVALYTVMRYLTQNQGNRNVLIGVALPFEKNHVEFINDVKYAIDKLNIIVFWVKEDEVIINASELALEQLFGKLS